MALFKDFTFDGENSKDYGVYISGEAVYDAPDRAMDMVQIPGRNGALALDNGYYNNIPVTYPAGCFADDQEDFAAKLSRIRNMLASRHRYCRLEDSYHPDHFRLALYRSGLDVSPVAMNRAGRFNITFDAKPQRFLKTGEEIQALDADEPPTEVYGPADIVTFQGKPGDSIVSSVLQLAPVQDLHGYDAPWPAGGWKNILPMTVADIKAANTRGTWSGNAYTVDGVTFTIQTDIAGNITGVTVSGTATSTATFSFGTLSVRQGETYTISGSISAYGTNQSKLFCSSNAAFPVGNRLQSYSGSAGTATALADDTITVSIFVYEGVSVTGTFYPQVELGSTATSFAPYSNICPISGWTGANIVVSPTLDAQDGTTYSVTWQDEAGTVYGGTLDVTTGVLTNTMESVDLGDLTWNKASSGTHSFFCVLSDKIYGNRNLLCEQYPINTDYWGSQGGMGDLEAVYDRQIFVALASGRVFITDSTYTNEDTMTFKAAMSGVQLVYELATPVVYDLTAEALELLIGTNNVFSDTGTTTITVQSPYELENPTLYPSRPLIRVYGSGTIQVNDVTITVAEHPGYIDIDCDLMDCYMGADNMNQYVSFSGNDFPELQPGINRILLNGPERVEITPRWWEL